MLSLAVAVLAAQGLPHTVSQHLVGASNEIFGTATRFAGDVDADGYGDVLVCATANVSSGLPGRVYVVSGATGQTLYTYTGIANTILGMPIDGAQDCNGDGHDDFLIGNGALNYARLYSGLDGSMLFQFDGQAPGDSFGGAVSGVGDIDGDGHPDVMVGATIANPGYAMLYSGATGALLWSFSGGSLSGNFGTSVSAVGDVDGDGHVDLAVGATLDGHRILNLGAPPFIPPHADTDHVGTVSVFSGLDGHRLYRVFGRGEHEGFGYSIDATGDVDGDGFDDFVVGTDALDDPLHSAYARVVSGHDGSTIRSFLRDLGFGYRMVSVSGAGDVDHDGVPDILVGGYGLNSAPIVFLYSGLTGLPLFSCTANPVPMVGQVTVDGGHDVDQGGTDDFLIGVAQMALGAGYVDLYVAP